MGESMNIGVFDSGFGGLTVLRALLDRLPGSQLYLSRGHRPSPLRGKIAGHVARYAVSSAHFLVEQQKADYLVIACNTASALALDAIRDAVTVPVHRRNRNRSQRRQGSTKPATCWSWPPPQPLKARPTLLPAMSAACEPLRKPAPLLVPLVEEGWIDHPVTEEVLRIYLSELLEESAQAALQSGYAGARAAPTIRFCAQT